MSLNSASKKKVFILGAGFSAEAGFPLQKDILPRLSELSLMDSPINASSETIDSLILSLTRIKEFLSHLYSSDLSGNLEDIFTLLDQSIYSRQTCKAYDWKQLVDVRDSLKRSILFLFHKHLTEISNEKEKLYHFIASTFIRERVSAGQKQDAISIISVNWDSLVEKSFYDILEKIRIKKKIDIDYCCYTTPLDSRRGIHIPSIIQKAKGLYNLKLMKLHGSSNWLLCPNCGRLYTGLSESENIWQNFVKPKNCLPCSQISDSSQLEPFIITPTYLKVFDNAHIQMTWHNAFIDLAEADKIIFIGYSLPYADYHIRTLLKRAIQKKTNITVVLGMDGKPTKNTPKKYHGQFASNRYEEFFSDRKIHILTKGTGAYFRTQYKGITLDENMSHIKKNI